MVAGLYWGKTKTIILVYNTNINWQNNQHIINCLSYESLSTSGCTSGSLELCLCFLKKLWFSGLYVTDTKKDPKNHLWC